MFKNPFYIIKILLKSQFVFYCYFELKSNLSHQLSLDSSINDHHHHHHYFYIIYNRKYSATLCYFLEPHFSFYKFRRIHPFGECVAESKYLTVGLNDYGMKFNHVSGYMCPVLSDIFIQILFCT